MHANLNVQSLVIYIFWPSWCIILLYLSLQRTQTGRFSINGSICKPEAGWSMLYEAHRLSILNLRRAHAFHISLLGHFNFLLYFQLKVRSSLWLAKKLYTTQWGLKHNSGTVDFAWQWPLKFWSRRLTSWNLPSLRPPTAVLSLHPDKGICPLLCDVFGKTAPI